jgi:hypothetical protein
MMLLAKKIEAEPEPRPSHQGDSSFSNSAKMLVSDLASLQGKVFARWSSYLDF